MNQQTQQVIEHLKSIRVRMYELLRDLPARRELIEEYFAVDPSTATLEGSFTPVDAGGVPAEWVVAENANPDYRVIYIHGGSWISGSATGYRALASRISRATGCAVMTIDYRLAPEHQFPAGLHDCCDAYLWMLENGPSGARTADKAVICGDSAGGNLALSSALRLQDLSKRMPDAVIALSPATDFTASSDSLKSRAAVDPIIHPAIFEALQPLYLPQGQDLEDTYVSPYYGDYTNFPPLLLQVGDSEVLLDESTRLAWLAEQHGCDVSLQIWDEMPHVFQGFAPFLPQANQAIDCIGDFVKQRLA